MVERWPRQDGRRADGRAEGSDKRIERALSADAAAGGCTVAVPARKSLPVLGSLTRDVRDLDAKQGAAKAALRATARRVRSEREAAGVACRTADDEGAARQAGRRLLQLRARRQRVGAPLVAGTSHSGVGWQKHPVPASGARAHGDVQGE
eukprot:5777672-Prymnesium_polylepis.1